MFPVIRKSAFDERAAQKAAEVAAEAPVEIPADVEAIAPIETPAVAAPTQKPTTKPSTTPKPATPSTSNCDTNYTGGCVPVVSYDLDCGDISFSVRVVGTDKHRFDGDKDGYGCENN